MKIHQFAAFPALFLLFLLSAFGLSHAAPGFKVKVLLSAIQLPPGFSIDVYTDQVPGARSMALSPSGALFVGTRQNGKVYAVLDKDGDGHAEDVHVVARGLDSPNGVAYRDGDLYVAEIKRILRYAQIESLLGEKVTPEVIFDGFPGDRHQ